MSGVEGRPDGVMETGVQGQPSLSADATSRPAKSNRRGIRLHKSLVLGSAVYLATMNLGSAFSFAVLFEDIRILFKATRAEAAVVQSVFFGILFCSGFLVGVVIHRIGPRGGVVVGGLLHSLGLIVSSFATSILFLQLSYGVICGLGAEFVYLSSSVIIPRFFKGRWKVLALTAVAVGPGLGGIFFPYVLNFLSETYGLHGTFLIWGGFLFNVLPCALLWTPYNTRRTKIVKSTTETSKNVEDSQKNEVRFVLHGLVRNKLYILFCIGSCLTIPCTVTYQTLIVDIWRSKGLTTDNIVMLLMVFYLVGLLGRLGVGFLKQIPRYSVMATPMIAGALAAAASFVLVFIQGLGGNIVISAVLGIGHGALLGSIFIVLYGILETSHVSVGVGIYMGFLGIISAVSAPIHGHLRDISATYSASIWFISGSLSLGAFVFLIALVVRIRQSMKRRKLIEDDVVTHF